jgi:methyl-accepting chemotaxis protein/methyl-accepting chemotaxis protein-1 (serine sensor receptor)
MTISKKLYASLGALIGLLLVLGTAAWIEFGNIGDQVASSSVSSHKLALAGEIKALGGDMLSVERGMIVRTFTKDTEGIEKYNAAFAEDLARRQNLVKEYMGIATGSASREILQSFTDSLADRTQTHDDLDKACMSGDSVAAEALMKDKLMELAAANITKSDKLEQIAVQQVTDDDAANQSAIATSRWIIGIIFLLSMGVAGGVIFVVRQINQALHETVSDLTSGAEQIASAASQVASSSQSLAQGSSEQAASLEESSASAEEINSMARRTSEDAGVMTTLVSNSQQQFVHTNQQLADMVSAMDDINDSSSKISKIIKVIDEIAFQTNILALNAAVEAARAGQAGMGFAVVADEVRNLAQRCAQAARDTTDLIEDSVAKSGGGKTKLGVVATSIGQITDEFCKVKMLVDQVASGSGEQSRGIEQIRTALGHMEQVTQGTAGSAEQSAAAAEQLNAQSDALKSLVVRLNTMVGGDTQRKSSAYALDSSSHRKPGRVLHAPTPSPYKGHAARPANAYSAANGSSSKGSFPLAEDFAEVN